MFQSPEGRTENSPGLEPWERRSEHNRPERATDLGCKQLKINTLRKATKIVSQLISQFLPGFLRFAVMAVAETFCFNRPRAKGTLFPLAHRGFGLGLGLGCGFTKTKAPTVCAMGLGSKSFGSSNQNVPTLIKWVRYAGFAVAPERLW